MAIITEKSPVLDAGTLIKFALDQMQEEQAISENDRTTIMDRLNDDESPEIVDLATSYQNQHKVLPAGFRGQFDPLVSKLLSAEL